MTSRTKRHDSAFNHIVQALKYKPETQLIEWFALIHSVLISVFGTVTLLYYIKFYYHHIKHTVQYHTVSTTLLNELSNTNLITISVLLFTTVTLYYIIDLIYLTLYTPHNTLYYTYALHHILTSLGVGNAVYVYYKYMIYDIVWILPVLAVVEYSNPTRSLADICYTYQQQHTNITHNNTTVQYNKQSETQLRQRKSMNNAYTTLITPKLHVTSRDNTIETLINIHAILFFVVRMTIVQYTVRVYYYVYQSYVCMFVAVGLILFSAAAGITYLLSVDGGINGCVDVNNSKQKLDVMV